MGEEGSQRLRPPSAEALRVRPRRLQCSEVHDQLLVPDQDHDAPPLAARLARPNAVPRPLLRLPVLEYFLRHHLHRQSQPRPRPGREQDVPHGLVHRSPRERGGDRGVCLQRGVQSHQTRDQERPGQPLRVRDRELCPAAAGHVPVCYLRAGNSGLRRRQLLRAQLRTDDSPLRHGHVRVGGAGAGVQRADRESAAGDDELRADVVLRLHLRGLPDSP
mmetsp:Transcript_1544/g.6735  ORF Transcript_1544/g.6735 Transcript_1544/m.6735 type:complete len:218 (-) Transcript_1544:903-1556(-)